MSLLLTLNKHIFADLWIIPRKASKARKVLRSNTRKYRAEKFHMMLLLRSILNLFAGLFSATFDITSLPPTLSNDKP